MLDSNAIVSTIPFEANDQNTLIENRWSEWPKIPRVVCGLVGCRTYVSLIFQGDFFLDIEFLDRWRKISKLGIFQSTLLLLVLIVLENFAVILMLASL